MNFIRFLLDLRNELFYARVFGRDEQEVIDILWEEYFGKFPHKEGV